MVICAPVLVAMAARRSRHHVTHAGNFAWRQSVQVGDLVKVKNPSRLFSGDDEKMARALYPWKFEVGMVINSGPWGAYPGTEAQVHFPSAPEKQILRSDIEVISESA
tara:strand:- start:1388 stop:1708 length:321 start_codon:yes stop_codon:yes gene_type:complete